MPQITPGGKYVFGWSIIHTENQILIPPETMQEYGFVPGKPAFMISGSKTSGAFSLGNQLFREYPIFSGLTIVTPISLPIAWRKGFSSHIKAELMDGSPSKKMALSICQMRPWRS
jgi:hypothetical protein